MQTIFGSIYGTSNILFGCDVLRTFHWLTNGIQELIPVAHLNLIKHNLNNNIVLKAT